MRGQYFSEVDRTSLHLDRIQKYAEPIRLPMIVRKNGQTGLVEDQTTDLGAVVNNAKIFVLFGGSTDKAEQQIDVYDQRTGLYIWSIALRRKVSRFDIQGDRLVVIERGEDGNNVVSEFGTKTSGKEDFTRGQDLRRTVMDLPAWKSSFM